MLIQINCLGIGHSINKQTENGNLNILFSIGQLDIEVKGNRAVIAGTETLCGASVTVHHAVKKLNNLADCSVVNALLSPVDSRTVYRH